MWIQHLCHGRRRSFRRRHARHCGDHMMTALERFTQHLAACPLVAIVRGITPAEAFAALQAGAHVLKLFPAEGANPAVLKAQRAVLPRDVPILMVGGITPDNMRDYLAAGANGFGLGSGLYSPGRSAADVAG